MVPSPSRSSKAVRCYVQICAALTLAPLIVLLTVSGVAAGIVQAASESAIGTVQDALGRPVTNALLILRAADGRTVLRTTSGEHGVFKVRAQLPGTYDLIAQKSGFKPANQILVFPAAARLPFTL